MVPPNKLALSTMSVRLPSADGRPPDQSKSRSCRPVTDASSSRKKAPSTQPKQQTGRKTPAKSSTAESRRQNRKKISKDKSPFYLTNIPNTILSPTSDPDSTGADPDFYPFWYEPWRDEYQKWSLPAKTDSVALPSTSSPSSSNNTMQRSWFSIKETNPPSMRSEKMSWQSCRYSLVDGTGNAGTKSPGTKVRKIRVYPNPRQKQMLARMAGTTRFIFNHVTSMIRDRSLPFDSQVEWDQQVEKRRAASLLKNSGKEYTETEHPWLNFMYMRNFLVNNTTAFVRENPWMRETPNSVRQIAVREGIASYKAALTNLQNGNITCFNTPFRRRRVRSWSIGFDPKQLQRNKLLPSTDFGRLRVSETRFLKNVYKSQPRITRDRNMRYWLLLIEEKQPTCSADEPTDLPIMSIDPGIRTRHTIFSTTGGGSIHEIGAGDIQRIVRIAKHIDKNISDSSPRKVNHKRRRRLLKHRLKMRARIENLKREIDYKTIAFLKNSASIVLLPDFKAHGMACRLRSKIARSLLCWGHGLFKQRLLDAASRCGTLKVMIVSEHYTSKTCGGCGRLNNALGGNKVFRCRDCGFHADRDHNGARNIMLRALREA